jgi:molybdopterin-containing oxidoreductase family iron-sulfur binding subunit
VAEREGAAAPLEPGEFPEGAAEAPEGLGRRSFLKVLGASTALAGLQACQPPREPLVPYVRPPPGVTPSVPNAYATAASDGGYAVGLVVTSWEGRPTKIEGNPAHPASGGGSDAARQALVLDLYDPARLSGFRHGERDLSLTALLQEIAALTRTHEPDQGARLRFLVEPTSSPTLAELRRRIAERFPRARLDAWTATPDATRAGTALAHGRPLEPVLALADADVVLSLEADLLAREGEPLRQSRELAARRVPGRMNRLYVAEADFTVTGGMADHRLRMRSADVARFGRAVAAELAAAHGLAALAPLGAPAEGEQRRVAAAIAKDLARARGRSLVAAGAGQPPAVHALAAALNAALGNVGRTVRYFAPALDLEPAPDRLATLVGELRRGQVDTLVVTAWNPLHTAPADLELRAAFGKAKNTLVHALREDETVRAATWRVAAAHALESWGDLRSRDGTTTIVQPLIAPLVPCVTEAELLAAFLGEGDRGSYRLVRDGWRARGAFAAPPPPAAGSQAAASPLGANRPRPPDPFERRWREWLAAGVVPGRAREEAVGAPDAARIAAALRASPAAGQGLEVRFVPDYKVQDGRYYENSWLQELPHPVTKLTWENAAHLSPATARRLGVADGDVLALSRGGRTLSAPALVVPGHADDSVTLTLGWGQTVSAAIGRRGYDAYALRASDGLAFAGGAEARRAGRRVDLAVTQGHFSMTVGGHERAVALAVDEPELERAQHELDGLRGEVHAILPAAADYSQQEYRWGMAIDLSRCVGCAACTVACQAENNIPVVGKEQVLRSREMHWLRVDRYFEGTAEDPASVTQPLMCVHCEKAPCEYVCPVNATVHSDEGLNEMVYNRCVGTRYCSNNCPYKVRRFNWLDFHKSMPPTLKMLQNPDVTVRARGVMEKCTYCTQRIERARIGARVAGRKIGPDEVVPACAQACPAEAIVFGNLNDPNARVSRMHGDARRYDLLHELGTKPRTAYLVKVRNPNPELA